MSFLIGILKFVSVSGKLIRYRVVKKFIDVCTKARNSTLLTTAK